MTLQKQEKWKTKGSRDAENQRRQRLCDSGKTARPRQRDHQQERWHGFRTLSFCFYSKSGGNTVKRGRCTTRLRVGNDSCKKTGTAFSPLPTRSGRRVQGQEFMRNILLARRQKREDALFAVRFTEKSADGRRSQNVSLVTIAKPFFGEARTSKRFRFFRKRNKNFRGWAAGAKVRFPTKTGPSL
jgi:hypothetical protein